MKYPEILTFSEVLARLDGFDSIVDVRSPGEYAEDHLPGAVNCPVLDDAQRVQVGTMYKQIGSFEAKKLGAALVARNIAQHIEDSFLDKPKNWRPLIYCWRGGNRSGSMAHILSKIGWPVAQLDGGYKQYRQHVNLALPELATSVRWRVVCGTTGSGKSRLLHALQVRGAQVLDLERLAAHRGSVLGRLPGEPQPSQKMFESRIWDTLRGFDLEQPVFVEAESKKVGDLRVPEAIMDNMRRSPCINLMLSTAHRVELLMQDYAHFVQEPASLGQQLDFLTALHGKEKIASWKKLAENGHTAELVALLLEQHYDPAYLRSINKNFVQSTQALQLAQDGIAEKDFDGSVDAVLAWPA